MKRFIVLLLALAAMVGGAAAAESSVLVIPARLRVVRLAFDVAAIRQSALVTYQFYAGSPVLQLHRWDGSQWVALSEGDFGSGAFLGQPVRQAVFVGTKEMPESLVESSATWVPDAKVIESIDIGQLVNELNAIYRFSSAELKWLADRHDLKIEDTNAQRRRYGRYGPPGAAKKPAAAPAQPAVTTAQTLQPLEVKLAPIPAADDVPVPTPAAAPAIMPAKAAPAAPAASNAAPAKVEIKPEDK